MDSYEVLVRSKIKKKHLLWNFVQSVSTLPYLVIRNRDPQQLQSKTSHNVYFNNISSSSFISISIVYNENKNKNLKRKLLTDSEDGVTCNKDKGYLNFLFLRKKAKEVDKVQRVKVYFAH